MNYTFGAGGLFASHLTLGTRANRVAHSRALRVIALPTALRVALLSNSESHETQSNEDS